MRKQFTFYHSFLEIAKNLPTKREKLEFFEVLCDYALDEIEPDLKTKRPSVATVFCAIRPMLDSAHAKSKAALCKHNLLQQPDPAGDSYI